VIEEIAATVFADVTAVVGALANAGVDSAMLRVAWQHNII
jgi:hypothetical protein